MDSLKFRMQRSFSLAGQLVKTRGFSTNSEKIVASVLFERLPVVIPKIDPVVYAFQEFQYVFVVLNLDSENVGKWGEKRRETGTVS